MIERVFTVGSLFSGYGGLELGLETTGCFKTIWHCENEPYPCAILRERWPGVPNLGDITKVDWKEVERPDVICGGFPCQDISTAGKRAGIEGERSGLWTEMLEAIRVLRPRYAVVENVSALAIRGLDVVLAGLAEAGYDAEWLDLRASDFGAPHRRERLFIVAYPYADRSGHFHRRSEEQSAEGRESSQREPLTVCGEVPDSCGEGLQGQQQPCGEPEAQPEHGKHCGWQAEPRVGRVAHRITTRMDCFVWRERIKALGNGVVPQVTEWVGMRIIEKEESSRGGV